MLKVRRNNKIIAGTVATTVLTICLCVFVVPGAQSMYLSEGSEASVNHEQKTSNSSADLTIKGNRENVAVVNEDEGSSGENQGDSEQTGVSNAEDNSSQITENKGNQNGTSNANPSGGSRRWIEPVYRAIEHPAVTHQEEYIESYTCVCGAVFSSLEAWRSHRPVPCDGKHMYNTPNVRYRTVVDKPAWSENVLVSEGHWE